MTAPELLETLRARGVELEAWGGRLRWRARVGVVTPALKDAMAAHKAALLALLEAPPPAKEPEPIQVGPYRGFLLSPLGRTPDHERNHRAREEAQRWEEARRTWLRRVLGMENEPGS